MTSSRFRSMSVVFLESMWRQVFDRYREVVTIVDESLRPRVSDDELRAMLTALWIALRYPLRSLALVVTIVTVGASLLVILGMLIVLRFTLRAVRPVLVPTARAKQGSRLVKPPGSHLSALARVVFGKSEAHKTFDALIADMQHEYFDAKFRHAHTEAAFARLRGYIAFWQAVAKDATVLCVVKGLSVLSRVRR